MRGKSMVKPTVGIALTGFAAVFALLALTPASASFFPADQADSPVLFGMAELVHKNVDGEVLSSQTVHNQLLDSGESILIRGAFGPTNLDESDQPAAICIGDAEATDVTEDAVAADFVPALAFADSGESTCILTNNVDSTDTTTDTSQAVLRANFTDANIAAGETITSLVICTNSLDNSNDNCSTLGEAFAVVIVPQPTLVNADDMVEVTYTFDLTSTNT
ncbi:hypothetical protein CENSYa_0593 [Cenarchaeum symbiosum A]|uniref:Uncharacterized protein n=1 Tax=Cenarchaeum symbiosum (strain A) TaxID=414004 RepID=A0RV59_CENSY|nr:hypothetical protein CENSYa_0593 [Cenarchaeum symbiosum A]